jgi:hypothetical protein
VPASTPAKRRKASVKKSKKSPAQPQLLLRTSERSTFKRCLWQWERTYGDKLKPIQEHPALKFGTLVHAALEVRYPPGIKRGPKPAETFEKLFAAERKDAEHTWKMKVDDDWDDALGVGIDMLELYIEKYGRDEDWKVIQSEMTFKVPVYIRRESMPLITDDLLRLAGVTKAQAEGKKPLFWYVGTMDGVWENRMDGGVRVQDYKTTGKDPTKEAAGKSSLDEQGTAYWTWGVDFLIMKKLLKPRQLQELDGMLYTFLRKGKRDPRDQNAQGLYLNQDGTVSKKQPPPMFHRELVYRSEVERDKARERAVIEVLLMMAHRRGVLPIFKTPETGQMGHCGFCPVRDLCELHESGDDWRLMQRSSMAAWDPYDAHEIEEEGKAK